MNFVKHVLASNLSMFLKVRVFLFLCFSCYCISFVSKFELMDIKIFFSVYGRVMTSVIVVFMTMKTLEFQVVSILLVTCFLTKAQNIMLIDLLISKMTN